jgi:hypothetical protein
MSTPSKTLIRTIVRVRPAEGDAVEGLLNPEEISNTTKKVQNSSNKNANLAIAQPAVTSDKSPDKSPNVSSTDPIDVKKSNRNAIDTAPVDRISVRVLDTASSSTAADPAIYKTQEFHFDRVYRTQFDYSRGLEENRSNPPSSSPSNPPSTDPSRNFSSTLNYQIINYREIRSN